MISVTKFMVNEEWFWPWQETLEKRKWKRNISIRAVVIVITANVMFFTRFPDLNYSKRLNLSDVPLSKDKYWSIVAYNQSKLCNLLFSMELNRRLKSKGVTCNAVHPGNLIYTSLPKNSCFYWLLFLMARPFAKTAVSKPSHPLK